MSSAIGRSRKARRTRVRRGWRAAMQPGPYPADATATIPECQPILSRRPAGHRVPGRGLPGHECARAAARGRTPRRRARRLGLARPAGAGERAGVFLVESTAPLTRAPIELTRVGKWIERVPIADDRRRAADVEGHGGRLGAFWLPSQTVLYVGSSSNSISGRVAVDAADGARRSSAAFGRPLAADAPAADVDAGVVGGHRCHRGIRGRAVHGVRGGACPCGGRVACRTRPSCCRGRTCDGRPASGKATGIAGSLLTEEKVAVPPVAGRRRAGRRCRGCAGRAAGQAGARPARAGRRGHGPTTSRAASGRLGPPLTAEGAERMRAELRELTEVKRPEVIARIRTAQGTRRPQGECRVPRRA